MGDVSCGREPRCQPANGLERVERRSSQGRAGSSVRQEEAVVAPKPAHVITCRYTLGRSLRGTPRLQVWGTPCLYATPRLKSSTEFYDQSVCSSSAVGPRIRPSKTSSELDRR